MKAKPTRTRAQALAERREDAQRLRDEDPNVRALYDMFAPTTVAPYKPRPFFQGKPNRAARREKARATA